MCWISNKKPVVKIAKRNIKCYKLVDYDYGAIFFNREYEQINIVYKAQNHFGNKVSNLKIRKDDYVKEWYISEGIHSFRAYPNKRKYARYHMISKPLKVMECVIPQGAKYVYYNNQYVSLSIVRTK